MQLYPGAEFTFVMGSDMLFSFEEWYRFRFLLENMTLGVFCRSEGEDARIMEHADYRKRQYGAKCVFINHEPKPMSSSDIRHMLPNRRGASYLPESVYARIIKNGDYDAKPEAYTGCAIRHMPCSALNALPTSSAARPRPSRLPIAGRNLKMPRKPEFCMILQGTCVIRPIDIVQKIWYYKRQRWGRRDVKLLHAKTGAALARDLFNISDEVDDAICWHTTGKPDMTLLEKIIYMADYIEPNRDFDGVDKLRKLAYENLDEAMALGLEMSLEDIRSYGQEPYYATADAYKWYSDHTAQKQ